MDKKGCLKSKRTRAKHQAVQSHIAPRTESLTQPSKSRNLVLPLVEVGSKDWGELCMLVLRDQFLGVSRANLKRRSGQTQFGVDVEGFDNRQDRSWSCRAGAIVPSFRGKSDLERTPGLATSYTVVSCDVGTLIFSKNWPLIYSCIRYLPCIMCELGILAVERCDFHC